MILLENQADVNAKIKVRNQMMMVIIELTITHHILLAIACILIDFLMINDE
jgi:hypothetical protein